MRDCNELLRLLRGARRIYIQTHDFPDHDSVASAFALGRLLAALNIPSRITYIGDVQRESLQSMIDALHIDMHRCERYSICSRDRVIIVDGCKGNRNVSHLPAPELAVIDHHAVEDPEDIDYHDIRADYGACSTIIYSYYRQMGVAVPAPVATALLIGISMDTAQLTRGVGPADVEAYSELYALADIRLVTAVVASHVQPRELGFYRAALENVTVKSRFAFCFLPSGCSQNLMGTLADFFLGLRDVDFVALCARNEGNVNFSVRCRNADWSASQIVQEVLNGVGLGGGHRHMAGGSIKDVELFDVADIYRRFCTCLNIAIEDESTSRVAFEKPVRMLQPVKE
jgi:nanoRNase/pAp phosphatase (c-di-AMP/oligoRNAs hydrolase)